MKIYLIHGWGGSPKSEGWFSWLKQECKKRNWELIIPKMPDTDYPKINKWVDKLNKTIEFDKDAYLIGHSIGTQTIMRYLEQLTENIKFKGLIFIAGFFKLLETAYESEEEKEIAKPWLETPINLGKVKKHTEKILAIFSTNDDCVPLSGSETFKQKLNAQIIIKKNQGHFNETQEIPEIIDFIEKN